MTPQQKRAYQEYKEIKAYEMGWARLEYLWNKRNRRSNSIKE